MELSATKKSRRQQQQTRQRMTCVKWWTNPFVMVFTAYALGILTGLFLSPLVICEEESRTTTTTGESNVMWRVNGLKQKEDKCGDVREELGYIKQITAQQRAIGQQTLDLLIKQVHWDHLAQEQLLTHQTEVLGAQLRWQKRWQEEQNAMHQQWEAQEADVAAREEQMVAQDIEEHIDQRMTRPRARPPPPPMMMMMSNSMPPVSDPRVSGYAFSPQMMPNSMVPPPLTSFGTEPVQRKVDAEDDILPALELTPRADLVETREEKANAEKRKSKRNTALRATLSFENLFSSKPTEESSDEKSSMEKTEPRKSNGKRRGSKGSGRSSSK